MYRLKNVLRPYAWGSATAMAELFGRQPSGGPEAELWIGAHPDSPSSVLLPGGTAQPLDAFIADQPDFALGGESIRRFGARLPFLAKVLAADSALSLQVHPSQEQARAGYAAENAAQIPVSDPARSYKDENHKPEMIYALTSFEALCGFRQPRDAARLFTGLRGKLAAAGADTALLDRVVAALQQPDGSAGLRTAFVALLEGGAESAALVDATAELLAGMAPGRLGPDFTTVAWLAELYPQDPGTLISLLLNRVTLEPGQALCLPAGQIHAYLRGLGVEVMASSDNVLRCGLTPKHVDIAELVRICDFSPLGPPLVEATGTEAGQELYCPPFAEFQLQRIELRDGDEPVPLDQHGPAVVLAVAGSARLDSPRADLALRPGDSAFIPDSEQPVLAHPVPGSQDTAVLFAVTTSGHAGSN
ncbi:mannose-6-phosphate isomerase, class I [Arthrobacter sp. I2-34]|uniref:mannose-6-phosphate isomerase n=1 Tax=Arthrobacter hankyongi TaxID=2904801 RepID=A0ABS9L1X2_9MICC|nr:mannose-6-phosphate isomerase, class I [Arthrobacter hankyongi]MCG2620600.1 mannose-6-phosphate isomerase, class I [Arthrobacter hankyongi]